MPRGGQYTRLVVNDKKSRQQTHHKSLANYGAFNEFVTQTNYQSGTLHNTYVRKTMQSAGQNRPPRVKSDQGTQIVVGAKSLRPPLV